MRPEQLFPCSNRAKTLATLTPEVIAAMTET
jgi:hypothetical protein